VLVRVEELELVALNLERVENLVLVEDGGREVGRGVGVAEGARLDETHGGA
jgi:hypothetical protein